MSTGHYAPHAAGFSAGLSPAPQAEPHAAGFSAGLSDAPHAAGFSLAPHAAAGACSVFCVHPNKFESAINVYLLLSISIFMGCPPSVIVIITSFSVSATTHFFITRSQKSDWVGIDPNGLRYYNLVQKM
jgi:hypothetical protein